MSNTVFIATGNAHKIQEIQSILPHIHFETPASMHISVSVEETGNSFLENALLKARAYHHALMSKYQASKSKAIPTDLCILAEDSGLCVEALDGRPHIHSARYEIDAFETHSHIMSLAHFQCQKIVEEMESHTNRHAYFVCCAVLFWHTHNNIEEYIVCKKTWHGEIITNATSVKNKSEETNLNGFGYDPIFYIPALGCTAATLSPHEKNTHSHRAGAMTMLASHIR